TPLAVGRGVHRVVQRLVAVLSHEVRGEDHDGRSEAGEGVPPEPAQEGVAPPRVLALKRHPFPVSPLIITPRSLKQLPNCAVKAGRKAAAARLDSPILLLSGCT
ncbi:hypothetical protein THAOC_09270, partial [Thalassiosira oceanica]